MAKTDRIAGSMEWSRACYGICADGDGLIAVRADKSMGRIVCKRVDPADPAVREEVSRGSLPVAGCLSVRESFARLLTAPFPSLRKARQVLPSLLDIQLPFPLEDCAYVFLPAARSQDMNFQALAVAARLADINARLEACKAHGFDPAVLDQEGIALWTQGLLEAPPAVAGPRVLVYAATERATVVAGNGKDFLAAHSVRADVAGISRVLQAQFGDGARQFEWLWAGPAAAGAAALRTDLAGRWPGRVTVLKEPETFLARAVATRALSPGPLRCDLRTGSLIHPAIEARARAQWRNTAAVVLASGVLLCVCSLFASSVSARRLESAKSESAKLAAKVAPRSIAVVESQVDVDRIDRAQKESAQLHKPFVDAFEPSITETLKGILEVGLANGLVYETVTIRGKSASVTGSAKTGDSCDRLVRHLEENGFPVKLDRRSGDGDTRFFITPAAPAAAGAASGVPAGGSAARPGFTLRGPL